MRRCVWRFALLLMACPLTVDGQAPMSADTDNFQRNSPLERAILTQDTAQAITLLKGGADPNERGGQGQTPLMFAAQKGKSAIVQTLLEHGADVDGVNDRGETALMLAMNPYEIDFAVDLAMISARTTDLRIIRTLLAWHPELAKKNADGYTALMWALETDQPAVVALLKRAGASTQGTENAALLGAIQRNDLVGVRRLLKKGADPNARSRYRHPALVKASSHGQTEIVRELLARGADIEIRDEDGRTPLVAALHSPKTVRLLIAQGARCHIVSKNSSILEYAASENAPAEVVRLLVKQGNDPNFQDELGITPLMRAANAGSTEMVRELLAQGARIHATDQANRTALHFAVFHPKVKDNSALIKLLLSAGADPNAREENGVTPLLMFLQEQLTEESMFAHSNPRWVRPMEYRTLRALIAAGADGSVKAKDGSTPLATARSKEREDIVRLLKRHGVKE